MTWLYIASVKLMACRASNSGFSNQINAMARCRGDSSQTLSVRPEDRESFESVG